MSAMAEPAGMDPFSVLGLPARMELSAGEVEAAYLRRAAVLHPDLARGDAEAVRASARLNEARAVVLDPERRAGALLARLGGAAAADDRSLPAGFLAQMMATRLELDEEVAAEGDAARDRWRAWALAERATAQREVAALLTAAEAAAATNAGAAPAALAAVRQRLNAWRYIERLIEQLDAQSGVSGGAGGDA